MLLRVRKSEFCLTEAIFINTDMINTKKYSLNYSKLSIVVFGKTKCV